MEMGSPPSSQTNSHLPVSGKFPCYKKIDSKMVIALGPGKFYGSSLPRPRFYTDVKFNDERVDPPAPMLDPLLSWAADAHWSMGGLSTKRLRLQGRIEGNVKKLQKEREKSQKVRSQSLTPIASIGDDEPEFEDYLSDSPPPTPIVTKRKTRRALLEEEEEEEDVRVEVEAVEVGSRKRRRLIRKLKDDFDLVADDAVNGKGKGKTSPVKDPEDVNALKSVASRTRGRRSDIDEVVKSSKKKLKKAVIVNGSDSPISASPKGARTSPRLSKTSSR